MCVFRSFKTPTSSILKQLEIKIVEVTQDFKNWKCPTYEFKTL